MEVNYLDFMEFLKWIALLGAPYLTGRLFSYIAENISGWHTLPTKLKTLIPFLFSITLSIVAQLILQNPEFVNAISPYYLMLAQAVVSYLGTQDGYMQTKRSNYGRGNKSLMKY